MNLQKHHWLILIGVFLVLILYFGFSIKSSQSLKEEVSRALISQVMSTDALIVSSKSELDNVSLKNVELLEQRFKQVEERDDKLKILEELAGLWYRLGNAAVSGSYAQRIAELRNDADSWSIAGTTFVLCLQTDMEPRVKEFCAARSRSAFENAISLDPEKVSHRVNLALSYVEFPPEDNPMKGVLMLRELQEKYPDNVSVLFNLGRLAMKTGQYERAVERLEQARVIDPSSKQIGCLLSKAYEGSGDIEKAAELAANCE
jgi:tetratricopeptide (TPR) repeat protein